MESGRLYNKQLTTTAGSNVTNSSTQSFKRVDITSIPTSTGGNLQYSGEEDSISTLSGAGGHGYTGSPDSNTQRWGWTAPSGSRVEVNDTPGGETIEIVHKSGAGVQIDSDGAIYIVSQSQRGAGISAPFGDIFISASGDVVIKGGSSLTVQTSGDLNLDVGGTFQTRCESYNLIAKSYSATIDGAAVTNITNDLSTIIGGIERKTVAGDTREQITGNKIVDVGIDFTSRVGRNNKVDVKGTSTHTIDGDHTLSSKASTKILSAQNTSIDTGTNLDIKTTGNVSNDAGGSHHMHITGGFELGADGNVALAAGQSLIAVASDQASIQGNDTTLLGRSHVQVASNGPAQLIGSTTSVSGSVINLKTSTVIGPIPSGSAGGPDTASIPPMPDIPDPDAPAAPDSAADAEVMDANDIVDTLTSARKYPEYPGNGVLESAGGTSYSTVDHDATPQAEDVYNEYSGGNQGNINPSQSQGEYDTLPEDSTVRSDDIEAVDVNKDIPAQNDLSAKISKYITVGMLTQAKSSHRIPAAMYKNVMKNHILLANNVLDPIKERFPDLVITSAYRHNSSNHRSGKAIDIVVESRSMTKHAEIARFARDFLPVDQVFLERNTSGKTHVHLRVANPGTKTKPSVLTCGDPKCRSKVAGIQVEWLGRRAKA